MPGRSTYPLYDEATNSTRFNDLLVTLNTLPACSIVLLYPCCHNLTGADLIHYGMKLKARELISFLDIAYQGFGTDMDEDAYAIRAIASIGLPALVSVVLSSKNFLAVQRARLSMVCEYTEERVLGQLKATVR